MTDGDLFKGGFGGQGLYVSPARDLVIAFAGTPRLDGSTNLLRWFSRRIATGIFGPSRATTQRDPRVASGRREQLGLSGGF